MLHHFGDSSDYKAYSFNALIKERRENMANVKTVVSYTLAAMAGIFFVKGLAVLSLDRSVK